MGICKDENCELVKCKNSAICLDCLAACLVNDPDTRECLYCKKECDCDIAKALNSEEIKQRVNKIREQRSFGRRKLRRSRHKLRRSKKIRKFRTSIRKNNVPKIRRSRKK
jgi:hypothetical protein